MLVYYLFVSGRAVDLTIIAFLAFRRTSLYFYCIEVHSETKKNTVAGSNSSQGGAPSGVFLPVNRQWTQPDEQTDRQWRNDGVAAASSDGGPTGGRGPPTVLFYFKSEEMGPDVRKCRGPRMVALRLCGRTDASRCHLMLPPTIGKDYFAKRR